MASSAVQEFKASTQTQIMRMRGQQNRCNKANQKHMWKRMSMNKTRSFFFRRLSSSKNIISWYWWNHIEKHLPVIKIDRKNWKTTQNFKEYQCTLPYKLLTEVYVYGHTHTYSTSAGSLSLYLPLSLSLSLTHSYSLPNLYFTRLNVIFMTGFFYLWHSKLCARTLAAIICFLWFYRRIGKNTKNLNYH